MPNIQAASQLQLDIDSLRGETKLVESSNQSWGAGNPGVSTSDHQTRRIGAEVPDSSIMLRRQVEETIRLDFSRLMVSDISSRSRAVGSFVQAGMSLEDALKAAMLTED